MLCMMGALFAANWYFDNEREQDLLTQKRRQELQVAKQNEKLSKEVSTRIAKSTDLPLVSLYSDEQGQHLLATGIQSKDAILTFSWSQEMPAKVFSKKRDTSDTLQAVSLTLPPQAVGTPALYGKNSSSKIDAAILPESGTLDIQLVSLPAGSEEPSISLGQVADGTFRPLLSAPTALSVGLARIGNQFVPAGIYEPSEQKLVPLEVVPQLSSFITQTSFGPNPAHHVEERFYVLENEYQQLVFSSYGGALAEINLPFKTEENTHSVVREIEFDRTMVKDHVQNALFPSHPYYSPGEAPTAAPLLNSELKKGGYYPLLRRNLIEAKPAKPFIIAPRFYALNTVSEYPELAKLPFEVKEFSKNKIVFEAVQTHRRITKTFWFDESERPIATSEPNSEQSEKQPTPYLLNMTINIEGDSKGLWMTSGIPEVELITGSSTPTLQYYMTRRNKGEVAKIDLPKDKEVVTMNSIYPDWVCNSNGYLGMIINPVTEVGSGFKAEYIPGTQAPTRLVEVDQKYNLYKAKDYPGYNLLLPLRSSGGTMTFRVFAGPFSEEILKVIDATLTDPVTGYNPDYTGSMTFHGWFAFISEPFAKFLFILMSYFYKLTNSWGFAIILLTVALRLMLYPLNAWSMKSMRRMQIIAPDVAAIQARNKKDPKKAQVEIMELYRSRGVNPFTGCIPLLIQMPFLIGMFDLLRSAFPLRGAPFIPGWIDNLTAPDVIYSWGYPLFFIGSDLHLLPIMLGGVMYLQQMFSSTLPKDRSLWTDQQRQQKFMGNLMVIIFSVMFYNFPSGLNLYWLSSMLLGVLQQWITNKQINKSNLVIKPIVLKGKR